MLHDDSALYDILNHQICLRAMSATDAVDGSHHRHLGAKVQCRMTGRECLLLAKNGLSGHVVGTAALPPTADIQNLMSGSQRKMSA